MNQPPRSLPSFWRPLGAVACLLVVAGGSGCNFIHNYGTGTHLDPAQEKSEQHGKAKASTMQVAITTDAAAQVIAINFIRSSGSGAVDGFVADSIRRTWPGSPSTRAVVEIRYAPGTGFTEPKLLSSAPVS